MKKNILIIGFFTLAHLCLLGQEKVEEIVAVIGNKVISKIDLEKNKNPTTDECSTLEGMLLSNLISYHIGKQFSKKESKLNHSKIKTNAEIEADSFIKSIPKSQLKFVLEQYKFDTLGQLREEIIQKRIEVYQLQAYRTELTKDLNVTPGEVKKFFHENKDKLSKLEIEEQTEIQRITFYPKINPSHKEEIISKLNALKEEIEAGESFAKLAALHSQDPGSKFDGGLITGVKKGQMDKKFEAVAFELEEGQISKPFESSFGFHIIELEKIKGRELDLRHILIIPQHNEDELLKTENFANSIREELIEGKTTFANLKAKYEDPSNLKDYKMKIHSTEKIQKSELPVETSIALTGLEEGEFTYPYKLMEEEKMTYSIVKLRKIIPSHQIDLEEDYSTIVGYAKEEKINEKQKKWIADAISTTFIKIGKEYQNCNFSENWPK